MKLIDFTARNVYQTGTSYISAQHSKTSILLTNIEDVARYVTNTLVGFYNEETGNYSKWTFISKSDLNWNCCTESLNYEENLEVIRERLQSNGKFSFSGGSGAPKYKIECNRVENNFNVEVTTYVHITLSSDLFAWFTEDMMREALIKKIEYINEPKDF